MADDKSVRDAKAEALWSEVSTEPDNQNDIKALINSVAIALKEKQERTRKVGKPSAKLPKAIKKAAQKVVDQATAPKSTPDATPLESRLLQLEADITNALSAPALITIATYRDLDLTFSRIRLDANTIFGRALDERLLSIEDSLESVRVILNRNQEQYRTQQLAARAAARKALISSITQKGKEVPKFVSRGVIQAKEFLRKVTTPVEYVPTQSSSTNSPVLAEIPREKSVSAKPIKELVRATKGVAAKVSDVSDRSLRWIGKHLGNLSSALFRFLRAPIRAAGGATELLGLGVLAATFVKPMLDGVHDELKRRFGDEYLENFINGLWDKSWKFLVDQVKSFLGIKTEQERASDYTKQAEQASVARANAEAAYKANPTAENKSQLQKLTREESRANLAATVSNTDASYSPSGVVTVLNAKLNLYRNLSGPKKTQSKVNIQNTIDEEVTTGSLPQDLAQQLRKEGFKVAEEKVQSKAPVKQPSAPVATQAPVSASPNAAVGATPPPVAVSANVGPPMESSPKEPITATPATPTTQGSADTGSYNTSRAPGFTPGVAQVPTYMNDDPMMLFNSGVLTG